MSERLSVYLGIERTNCNTRLKQTSLSFPLSTSLQQKPTCQLRQMTDSVSETLSKICAINMYKQADKQTADSVLKHHYTNEIINTAILLLYLFHCSYHYRKYTTQNNSKTKTAWEEKARCHDNQKCTVRYQSE